MAKYKNLKTGNIVNAKNKAAAELMEKSENYETVTKTKSGKKSAGKPDTAE